VNFSESELPPVFFLTVIIIYARDGNTERREDAQDYKAINILH
jgi:hypothetical protein